MDALTLLSNHSCALEEEATNLQGEAERIRRLLPAVGKTAAIVGDAYEQRMGIVEVGDHVYSKYGGRGVVVSFDNVDADQWNKVSVTFTDDDKEGEVITHKADRLNYSGSILLD